MGARRLAALALAVLVAGAWAAPSPPAPRRADPDRPARLLSPDVDAPNPFVLVDRGRYHLYASQPGWLRENVQVRSGRRLDRLGPVRDAMPVLPSWVWAGFTWAPDVRKVGDRYVMWFTAGTKEGRTDGTRPTQCIGVAVSRSPRGPFVGVGDGPAICQLERWGSIDPRTFVDEHGRLWLHWKSDDNADLAGTGHTSIYARRLAADGTTLVGHATRILEADQPWEGRIVEAPQMVRAGGRHWLFYSGNWFNQPLYGIGVAACDGPAGPCRKVRRGPWLGSNAQGAGPGESSLFRDHRGWWIVYGPWAVDFETHTPRPVALAKVAFGRTGPYLAAYRSP